MPRKTLPRGKKQKVFNEMVLQEALKVYPRSELERMRDANEAIREREEQLLDKDSDAFGEFSKEAQKRRDVRRKARQQAGELLKRKDLPGKKRKEVQDMLDYLNTVRGPEEV